jgi:AcrR family transcriptional regulator
MSGNDRDMPRRDLHAEDSRQAILAAARQAFARHGYANTALESIVGPAGLTKGALYHHFKSKAAVLEAVYIEMEQELTAAVGAAVMAAEGGWARMQAAIDAFFELSSEPAYVQIVLRDAPHVLGSGHGRELDQAIGLGLIIELLNALASEGVLRPLPVVATARILLAAASEIVVAMANSDDPALTRREGTEVLLALLDGLKSRSETG